MPELSIDFETRSAADLKVVGAHIYAEDPTTDIWCMAWAFDDEEPELWFPTDCACEAREKDAVCCGVPHALPDRVRAHIQSGGSIRAWNAAFERLIWREVMVKRYGAPEVRDEQWVCTMAEAAAMAIPLGLDAASKALGLDAKKDDEGYRLMLRMAKPRKPKKGEDPKRLYWQDEPEKLARLGEYCKQDVRTERAAKRALRRLVPRERELYLLDLTINDRGFRIDRPLVLAAQDIVDEGTRRSNAQLEELTLGAVTEVTKTKSIREWLNNQGVETDSIAKAKVRELLERDDLSDDVTMVLALRADAGRSSVAKIAKMLQAAHPNDSRIRGTKQYHAAGTGRWGGRGVQPDNLPRGEIEKPEQFIPLVLARDYDAIDLHHHPIVVVLSLLRGMIVPEEGHDLIVADFSAIEARVLNWLAGQDDVLDLFRKMDAAPKDEKELYDPYRHNAAKLYGIPLAEVKKFPHRQTGKFQELGCGFQMGAKKAKNAARDVYGLELSDEDAVRVVAGYRQTHPKVKQYWRDVQDAALDAVATPGRAFSVGAEGREVKYVQAGAYLYCILPSGRALAYAAPRIVERDVPWCDICGKPEDHENHHTAEGHEYDPARRNAVTVAGMVEYGGTKIWGRYALYGGLQTENIVQAAARDLLRDAMFRAEEHGYPVVMHVHDEIVTEVPKGFGSVEEFERLVAALPEWAAGCPVAAEGWRGDRYKK